jgi:hypothetical protein
MNPVDITSYYYLYVFVAIIVSVVVSSSLEERLKSRPPATRPYRWGFYVGCMGVACAPLALLMAYGLLRAGMNGNWDAFGVCLVALALFTIQSIAGWFVIQRKRWAWVTCTIFSCNIFVWIINYIYGKNRWGEFVGEPYAGTAEEGYELLADATKLEAQGRVQEAIAAYQRVVDRYSHNAAGNDAKISIENLVALGHDISKKRTWSDSVTLGAQTFYSLLISESIMPSREMWESEFLKRQNSQKAIANSVMDELWKDSETAGREFERVGGKKRMQDIVMEILRKRETKGYDPQEAFDDYNAKFSESKSNPIPSENESQVLKEGKTMKSSPAKRIIKWAAIIFVASCLIPPWQFTADRNGNSGFHSHKPVGYSLIFSPPTNPDQYQWSGVQIDFGRLFIEWAAIVAIAGLIFFLRNDKESQPAEPH